MLEYFLHPVLDILNFHILIWTWVIWTYFVSLYLFTNNKYFIHMLDRKSNMDIYFLWFFQIFFVWISIFFIPGLDWIIYSPFYILLAIINNILVVYTLKKSFDIRGLIYIVSLFISFFIFKIFFVIGWYEYWAVLICNKIELNKFCMTEDFVTSLSGSAFIVYTLILITTKEFTKTNLKK